MASPPDRGRIAGWLAHPLVITVVSALLASVLIPLFTRQWQDRQKELDLKRDLVETIAGSSTSTVRSGISLALGHISAAGGDQDEQAGEVYPRLSNTWLVQRAITRSTISTYFPGQEDCWYRYSDMLTSYLSLAAGGKRGHSGAVGEIRTFVDQTRHTCQRVGDLPEVVQARYATLASRIKWADLVAKSKPGFGGSYAALGELLLIGKDGIVKSIVAAEARGYYHGLFH
jgi:hypothetical protein